MADEARGAAAGRDVPERGRPVIRAGRDLSTTVFTAAVCPSRVRTGAPVAAVQIRAVRSCDAVAISVPSGLNTAAWTSCW